MCPLHSEEAIRRWLIVELAARMKVSSEKIDVRKPFTRFGLNSIEATTVAGELGAWLGLRLPATLLWEYPTIEDMARHLAKTGASAELPPIPRAEPLVEEGNFSEYPLSANQMGFLYSEQVERVFYNVGGTVKIIGDINAPALKKAYQDLIDRHPALRAGFIDRNGETVQVIFEHAKVQFQEIDALKWTETDLQKSLQDEFEKSFPLGEPPLFRIILYRRFAREFILFSCFHHIIVDAWTFEIIWDELGEFYQAVRGGRAPSLPPIDYQYTDFALWERKLLEGPEGERHRTFWTSQLSSPLSWLPLPQKKADTNALSQAWQPIYLRLGREISDSLKKLSRENNGTLFGLLLAAFKVLLYGASRQRDILITTVASGRSRSELDPIVGSFISALPVRSQINGEESFLKFFGQVRQNLSNAIQHQDYPFFLLVSEFGQTANLAESPMLQIAFTFQETNPKRKIDLRPFGTFEAGWRAPWAGLLIESTSHSFRRNRTPIALEMTETENGLRGFLSYQEERYDREFMSRLVEGYQFLIEEIVRFPERSVDEMIKPRV